MASRNRQVRAVIRGLERLAERVIAKIVLDLTANLIEANPVDTGWSRANWVPSIGTPFLTDLSGIEPSVAGASAAGAKQQSALASVASGYRLSMGSVFVSNNVPYITKLNDGSSAQAPAGFVQQAIAKAVTQDVRGLR